MSKKAKVKQVSFLQGEKWKPFSVSKNSRKNYAVSSFGRVISYDDKMKEGAILRTRLTQRYPSISFRGPEGKNLNFYLHRLVAQLFLKKASSRHKFVIHLDHKKENNKSSNLKWVTLAEQIEHAKKDPIVIKQKRPLEGPKLTAAKVKEIKMKLFKSKKPPTLKALAKRFKVSDMQIYRIKSGENWGHVKV